MTVFSLAETCGPSAVGRNPDAGSTLANEAPIALFATPSTYRHVKGMSSLAIRGHETRNGLAIVSLHLR